MGGHQQTIKVPDYKIYKVADCPELQEVQEALAEKCLKDPWLRNEVWRFNKKHFPHHLYNLRALMFTGFKYGLVAAIASIIIDNMLHSNKPEEKLCYPPCPPAK